MKRIMLAALALTLLAVGLPLVGMSEDISAKPPADAVQSAAPLEADGARSIALLLGDAPTEMNVYDYLVGVLAAEMPASFEAEALKAQAVAARSYLERALRAGSKHENADICADSACCQAYISLDKMRENWGAAYEENLERIRSAVSETDGEYLVYDGEPVLAAFHSSSAGMTESSAAIWNGLPYLVSVDSPETASDVPNYISSLELNELDFRDTVLHLRPDADMTGDASGWLGTLERSDSGRVTSVSIGGVSISGEDMRSLFSLRSTAFELEYKDGVFRFTVTGHGHGVGMSQYGANVLARQGSNYREILEHYYPGTSLCGF